MICSYCGANNQDKTAFCRNCGRQLRMAQPEASSSRFPPPQQQTNPVQPAPFPSSPRDAAFPVPSSVPISPASRAPQRRRTSGTSNARNWLLLVLGTLVLLAVLGGATMFFLSHSFAATTDPATQTLTNYCNALKKSDYQSAWALWSSVMQNQMKESDFAYSWKSKGNISSCTVNTGSTNASSCTTTTCTGTITFFLNNGHSITDTLQLMQENGQWKIQSENSSS